MLICREHVEPEHIEQASQALGRHVSLARLETGQVSVIQSSATRCIGPGQAQGFASVADALADVHQTHLTPTCLSDISADVYRTREDGGMPSKISQALNAARVNAGLTQADIAKALGLDRGMVSHVDRGQKYTSYENVEKWFDVCGVRMVFAPKGATTADDIDTLDAESRALLLRLATVLPAMPVEQREFLADQVDLWTRRHGATSGPTVAAEPDALAVRGR